MTKRELENPPEWLENPYRELRTFHEIPVDVFIGEVNINEIVGWFGNPRTELHADQFRSTYGRDPTNEEMYQLVLNDNDPKEGLKIRDLAGDIYRNGVRVPIVLTYEKKLLDGNRRYYACMFLATEGVSPKQRKRFIKLPAIVLPKGTPSEIEDAIITEFNFSADYFVEWPYYIKAMKVYKDLVENNMEKDDLVRKYAVEWRYLSKWIQASELCMRFLDYHDQSYISKQFAYRNFIMFDEMMRNFGKRFKDANFRQAIFDILLTGYEDKNQRRFSQSSDVVRLDEIYDNPEAWEALISSKKGSQALKEALAILDLQLLDATPDPNPRLKRVLGGLEKLNTSGILHSAEKNLLERFHEEAGHVPGAPNNPSAQVRKMIEWLDGMTSKQIVEMEAQDLENLQIALERVLAMAKAVSKVERS